MKITYSYCYISCHYHSNYLHSIKMYMSDVKVSIYLFRERDLIVKFYGLTTNYAKKFNSKDKNNLFLLSYTSLMTSLSSIVMCKPRLFLEEDFHSKVLWVWIHMHALLIEYFFIL